MQRINGLYAQVCDMHTLLAAYRRAKLGTHNTEAYAFDFNLETELLKLRNELVQHLYEPQAYRYFEIYDPKQRTISVAAFRDRVVHHAVVMLLEPIFERIFIYHSYATRKAKGTHNAIEAAQQMMRKNSWYLKADVRKYFDSIQHQILFSLIEKRVKDKAFLKLVKCIIENTENGIGLPIGNLTSQFFANVYLHQLDIYVLHELKPSGYIRYMDDFVLFDNDKDLLRNAHYHIERFLDKELKLQLKPKATLLNRSQHGLGFLGTRIFWGTLRLKRLNLRLSLRRLRYKYHLYKRGRLPEARFLAAANSIMAHLKAHHTFGLRKKLGFLYHEKLGQNE